MSRGSRRTEMIFASGKQQLDQPDVLEVVGQLVDHVIGLGSVFAQFLQDVFGNAAADLRIEVVHAVRIPASGAGAAFPALESGDHARNRSQLAGTVDPAVSGDDLLDQRGAGTRHADDEHRHGGLVTAAGTVFVQRLGKGVADAGAVLAVSIRVVAQQPAAGNVGFVREGEGSVVVRAFFPDSGELKQQAGTHRAFHTRCARELFEPLQTFLRPPENGAH